METNKQKPHNNSNKSLKSVVNISVEKIREIKIKNKENILSVFLVKTTNFSI